MSKYGISKNIKHVRVLKKVVKKILDLVLVVLVSRGIKVE